MSESKSFGKDKVMFVTKEDHATPSTVQLSNQPEQQPGLILPNGDINWNCPCLGGMATGPCGVEFRDAFSCFHYSKEEPKGSDCYEAFKTMQDCFSLYPTVYNKHDDDDTDDIKLNTLGDSKESSGNSHRDRIDSVDQFEEKSVSSKST